MSTATASAPTNANDSTSFDFKNAIPMRVPLSKIRESLVVLRPVDKSTSKYKQGLESVRKNGLFNAISVRELKDPTTGDIYYGLIDGNHRKNWAMDCGMTEIPALVGDLNEANLLEAQIISNSHKLETKPIEFTRAIVQVIASNPAMTMGELCNRLSHTEQWLNERLGLLKLEESIQPLANDGTITVTNAIALSKLPHETQMELRDQAMSMPFAQFGPIAQERKKAIDKAKAEGRPENPVFTPAPRLKKVAELKAELASATIGAGRINELVRKLNITTTEKAVELALQYVLHIDPEQLVADEAAWNKTRADAKAKAELAKAERERKKLLGIANPAASAAAAGSTAQPV